MRQIADKLNAWSPAVFIGYNTLAFDEPLLRQAFYQTLQPVYLTNTHGNKRGDVLRLAQATAVLAPNAMAVPLNAKGKPTLKLDTLAPANGFAHENAHDALADVEATIYMARHIRDRAPSVGVPRLRPKRIKRIRYIFPNFSYEKGFLEKYGKIPWNALDALGMWRAHNPHVADTAHSRAWAPER